MLAKVISVAVERVRDDGEGCKSFMGTFSLECSIGVVNGLFDFRAPIDPDSRDLACRLYPASRDPEVCEWLEENMGSVGRIVVKTVAKRAVCL